MQYPRVYSQGDNSPLLTTTIIMHMYQCASQFRMFYQTCIKRSVGLCKHPIPRPGIMFTDDWWLWKNAKNNLNGNFLELIGHILWRDRYSKLGKAHSLIRELHLKPVRSYCRQDTQVAQEMMTRCWFNAGPPSQTVIQPKTYIGPKSSVCWVDPTHISPTSVCFHYSLVLLFIYTERYTETSHSRHYRSWYYLQIKMSNQNDSWSGAVKIHVKCMLHLSCDIHFYNVLLWKF